ncbi:MAG: LPS export ABC transporter permease LptG [Rhodobacteraceae bacterium]|nr:LPS export ABC transporter permease LptG [Paracoccaceae bacterium]MAY46518.1 LPS export ABC transporter permease LptG [Paracoccaceae bacterium]QEW21132.1 Lipopolysaccharide export system permease protein LptG [Marinibacterium anthonyi]
MILDRYFARRFLLQLAIIMCVLLTLMFLIELIEQVRRFSDNDVRLTQILYLVSLNVPAAMSTILPLITILATVSLFIGLARSSELVVTRATGRSGIRALLAPAVVSFLIGILAVAMLNPIVAASMNQYQRMSEIYRSGEISAASLSGEGLWLRQGDTSGQSVIHATGYVPEDSEIFGVTVLSYAANGGPSRRIEATSAKLENDGWTLKKAKIWSLTTDGNPEATAETFETYRLPSTLTPERIRETIGGRMNISVWDLPKTIRQLDEAGFSTLRHRVWYQSELSRPLFLVAMVLIGAAFTMRHVRFGGTGLAVLMAVLLGFGLYFIRNFAQILGENGQIPVPMAAWAAPVASVLLALGLLLHAEDG